MARAPRKPTSGTRVRPGRVLVVDDGAVVGRELGRALPDHDVIAVSCGEDAVGLLRSGKTFDLVLSDIVMPGMSGIELLACLEDEFPAQADRLLFMADRMVSPVVAHLLAGVPNLCVERPFDLDGLRALIERRIRTPSARTA